MSKVSFQISVSADGFMAGPDQSVDNPLGIGGEALHEWVIKMAAWREAHGKEGGETNPSSRVMDEATTNVGAVIMGRNMFGGGPGPWNDEWQGWWGDEPPFHVPVFVVTHHERAPLELKGTTFHFVTEGPDEALARAREAAGDADISVGGGAQIARYYLSNGVIDDFWLNIAPVILGGGEPLLPGLDAVKLEQIDAIAGPDAVNVKYRVVK